MGTPMAQPAQTSVTKMARCQNNTPRQPANVFINQHQSKHKHIGHFG